MLNKHAAGACALTILISVSFAAADVLPPHSSVGGQTIGQWSADWWNWALSTQVPNDVLGDATGANANNNQPGGPVFFIAGTTGSSATRSFTVPQNKFLLVPLVNSVASTATGDPADNLEGTAAAFVDGVNALHASIDGAEVPDLLSHRETSPHFNLVIPENNTYGAPAGSGDAVTVGYWLMIEPLSAGQHTLNFGGANPTANFAVDVTDTITVSAAAIPLPAGALAGLTAVPAMGLAMRRRRRSLA